MNEWKVFKKEKSIKFSSENMEKAIWKFIENSKIYDKI